MDNESDAKASYITVQELRKMFGATHEERDDDSVEGADEDGLDTVIRHCNENQDVIETVDKQLADTPNEETRNKEDDNLNQFINEEQCDDVLNGNMSDVANSGEGLDNDVNEAVDGGKVGCEETEEGGDKIMWWRVNADNGDTNPVSDVTLNAAPAGQNIVDCTALANEPLHHETGDRKLSAEFRIINNNEELDDESSEDSSMTSTVHEDSISDQEDTCQDTLSPPSFSLSTDAEYYQGPGLYLAKLDLNPDHHLQLSSLPEMFVDEEASTLSDVSPISDCDVVIGQDPGPEAVIGQLPCDTKQCDNSGQVVSQDNVVPANHDLETLAIRDTDNNNIIDNEKVDSSSGGEDNRHLKHSSITFIPGQTEPNLSLRQPLIKIDSTRQYFHHSFL